MSKDIESRHESYSQETCWQYDIRVRNMEKDMLDAQISEGIKSWLRVTDFDFMLVTDVAGKAEIKRFIERHEWLGTLSQFTTHWYGCYYNGVVAGAILFNVPNAFSKILGDDTVELERLISRGACISWSPKNLASNFLMWCIRDMVKTTKYRLFTAYSDPAAKELGSIYQACNFYYLGQNAGCSAKYRNPHTGKLTSDRYFRQKTAYKKFAKELGITWNKEWSHKTGMTWSAMPDDVEAKLRAFSKESQLAAEKVLTPKKHKYAMVLGKDRRETRKLQKLYLSRNKNKEYPKNRGEW